MPHDAEGNLLQVGDIVNLPCKIKEIYMTEEYCNCSLEMVCPMYPTNRKDSVTVNTRQVKKV